MSAETKSPVYFIGEIDLTDAEGYKNEYLPLAQSSIKGHGGRILAVGAATPFAGEPPKSRVVLMVWDSMEQLQGWFDSPEYKQTRKLGEKHAKYRNFAINGLPQ
jgi:uncharacterized protein (DUF1330 family)